MWSAEFTGIRPASWFDPQEHSLLSAKIFTLIERLWFPMRLVRGTFVEVAGTFAVRDCAAFLSPLRNLEVTALVNISGRSMRTEWKLILVGSPNEKRFAASLILVISHP
jgi:hypothetical protein